MQVVTFTTRPPKRLPKLHDASGHVVRLIDYVVLAQRSLPLNQRPTLNSHSVARMLREQGYDVASHSDNARVIANVSLAPATPKPFTYVIHGQRLARIYD